MSETIVRLEHRCRHRRTGGAVAFSIDYVVELWLVRDRRRFVRHEWTSLLIVVSQTIAVVPGFQAIGLLRALRGVRGMRAAVVLLRLVAIGGATAHEGRVDLRKHAAGLALGVAGLSWLTAAAAFTVVEDVGVFAWCEDEGEIPGRGARTGRDRRRGALPGPSPSIVRSALPPSARSALGVDRAVRTSSSSQTVGSTCDGGR